MTSVGSATLGVVVDVRQVEELARHNVEPVAKYTTPLAAATLAAVAA
jgi:hypothetical protein